MENFAAIYLRVSTEDQHPENQIADVKRLAEALKYKVVEVYVDRESGQYADRREFQKMMADAKAGKFTTLFIWALDRFSREGIETTLSHIKQLNGLGVALKSYQEQWLDTSIGGISELLVAVLSYAAKEELKRFRERSMAGKRRMLSEGKLIGCYPAYGWDYVRRDKDKGVDGYFKINKTEAFIVKKIYSLYLEVESIYLVAIRLRSLGIKSRGRGGVPRFFQASTLRKILTSESYIGNHYFGKSSPCVAKYHLKKTTKHRLTGRRKNPRSEWKVVKIPAILDVTTFNKVQELIKKRSKFKYAKKSKYEFLCQGLIKCTDCTRRYGGRSCKNFLVYRCPQAYNSNLNFPTCRSRAVGAVKLDNIVWMYVSSLISNTDRILRNVRTLQVSQKEKQFLAQKNHDGLVVEKDALKIKRGRLLDLYSESGIPKEDLTAKLSEIQEKEKMLDEQILKLKAELAALAKLNEVEAEVERMCALYKDKIKNPSFKLKRYITCKWIEEIRIERDGGIRIITRVPEGEEFKQVATNYPLAIYTAQRRPQIGRWQDTKFVA